MDPLVIFLALFILLVGVGLGATVDKETVVEAVTKKKRAILVGFFCQYGLMPLVAFALAKLFNFEVGGGGASTQA